MILKRFNVERVAKTEAQINALKAEGFVEVEEPKKAKKATAKKEGKKDGSDK